MSGVDSASSLTLAAYWPETAGAAVPNAPVGKLASYWSKWVSWVSWVFVCRKHWASLFRWVSFFLSSSVVVCVVVVVVVVICA